MLNTNSDTLIVNSWIERITSKLTKGVVITPITILLGTILLIISAKIKVPLYPVPMTLQPLAVLMIGMLFGRNLAAATVGLYIFQGLMGLPVFAYGGGFMYILGPTGGFIIGFLLAAIILGHLADKGWGRSLFTSILCMVIGLFIIYFMGILQLSLIKGFDYAILKGFYPFIIGDLYKLLLAGIIVPNIWKLAK